MKNESTFSKKFATFLKRAAKAGSVDMDHSDLDAVGHLVTAFLQWESTTTAAATAYKRLMARVVDYNDLRVSHPQEVKAMVGPRYPKADERVCGLLAALQEIYVREHAVTLDGLAGKAKKEVRAYLVGLPGTPSYVAAQVTLLCFGGHAVPVDDVLVQLLKREKVVDDEATCQQVESFLERQIRASDAVESHAVLRAWADAGYASLSSPPKAALGTRRASGKVTKKTTSKTTKKKVSPRHSSKA